MRFKNFKNFLFLSSLLSLFCCNGVTNKYSSVYEKICIYMNINNNNDRLFLNRFKENTNISSIDNCDYLVIATAQQTKRAILNSVGVRVLSSSVISVYYDIYKMEDNKLDEVQKVLNNPSIQEHINYTGGKNPAILKSSSTINENKEIMYENQSEHRVYALTKARIAGLLKNISHGFNVENASNTVNYALLTNLQQSKDDVENQLIKTLADRTYDDVLLDILEFKNTERQQKKKESEPNDKQEESEQGLQKQSNIIYEKK